MTCGNCFVAVLFSLAFLDLNDIPSVLTICNCRKSSEARRSVKMLEYFTYKKLKKHQAEKKGKASAPTTPSVPAPVITAEDEHFLERIISAEGPPPPLPERPRHEELPEAGDSTGNAAQVVVHDKKDKGKGKENERPAVKTNRFSFLHRNGTKKVSYFIV